MKEQQCRLLAVALACIVLFTACDRTVEQKTAPVVAETIIEERIPWSEFRDAFIETFFEFNPEAAISAGRHEYDGQLHDFSPEAVTRELTWLKARRAEAVAYPTEELMDGAAFERDYLIAAIDQQLFPLEVAEVLKNNPIYYLFGSDPSIYLSVEYAPIEARLAAFTLYASALPSYLAQMRENLTTPLARPHIEVATGIVGGLASFFEDDVPTIFAGVENRQLQEEFVAANAAAVEALRTTVAWLNSERENATDDFALGQARFLTMLKMTEGVEITLAELKAAGEADLERNLAALRAACAEYTPNTSIPDCIARSEAVKPEGGSVESARRQLAGLKQFLIDKDLVSIPGTEEALVDEAPPYARWNFAYINIPGPYEEDLPSTYYIAPPDPSWPEEDQLAYIPGRKKLLYVTVHEVWPGHFLNFLHANRAPSTFGRVFFTYSFVEGWAHYTEEMMWDAGLDNGDPESHIGQLSNALLRNVRFLSAIGLHTEGMTVEESRQMFQEKAFQDFGNASQQANRGTFDPGYLNYTLGKLMIRKLRDDWVADRGDTAAWKEFHDRFLSYGGPPIPLVREDMLGSNDAAELSLLP